METSLRSQNIAARKHPALDDLCRSKDMAHRLMAQGPYLMQLCALAVRVKSVAVDQTSLIPEAPEHGSTA